LKELISHAPTEDRLQGMLLSGGQLLNGHAKYVDQSQEPLGEIARKPHYVGLTSEVALSRWGSLVGLLFVHDTPRLALRPSEQRLLLSALHGGTDEELALDLGVSLSAVKKTWAHIYERTSAYLPDVCPACEPNGAAERGKEKKQRLLSYLRDHPEELRPASPFEL
jgi:DNA-binding CsgD family transcriptional regulator